MEGERLGLLQHPHLIQTVAVLSSHPNPSMQPRSASSAWPHLDDLLTAQALGQQSARTSELKHIGAT